MTDQDSSRGATADRGGEPEWKRRRRLAEVFGDSLPETTRDERDEGGRRTSEPAAESASDRWLKSQVPPHHGG